MERFSCQRYFLHCRLRVPQTLHTLIHCCYHLTLEHKLLPPFNTIPAPRPLSPPPIITRDSPDTSVPLFTAELLDHLPLSFVPETLLDQEKLQQEPLNPGYISVLPHVPFSVLFGYHCNTNKIEDQSSVGRVWVTSLGPLHQAGTKGRVLHGCLLT